MYTRTQVSSGLILAFGGSVLSFGAIAQQELQRVEITGSSIKSINAETALPVQILRREDIARTGATSTEDLLKAISAVSSQGAITGATGAGVSTYGVSSISLRGLGEDRTLVLVNGRRLAPFAGGNGASVNVNAIPLAAIERIEILKDGASGVYGSDAIAGVVNFILARNVQGVNLEATAGMPTRSGGGDSHKASIVAGFGNLASDRYSITLSAGLEKERALFAKNRDFAKTGNISPYVVSGATGQGNIEGGYNPGNGQPYTAASENTIGNSPGRQAGFGTSPGSGYGNPLAAQGKCADINMFQNPTNTTKGAPYCAFDSAAFVGLIPKRELTTFSGNLVFKINNDLEAFGDGLYSKSVVTQTIQTSPVRRSFLVTDSLFPQQGVAPALIIRPSNPNYKIASDYLAAMEAANPGMGYGALIGQPLAVTARVFDFGPRTSEDTSRQSRLTAGLRGTVVQQDWEVAASTNESRLAGTVTDGYFSQVAFANAVNAQNSDYNPWSLQQSAAFNAAIAPARYNGSTLDAKAKVTEFDGKISGEIYQLPAGPLQYATGLQRRNESLVTSPSPALGTGDIAGLGGATPPVDRDRNVTSAFVELNAPIIKGLDGNVALRRDKYNDVGGTNNYKASLRYQPIPQLLVRGSLGTGFRAPTLIDLFQPQTTGTSEAFNDNGPTGTGQTNLQVNSLSGGNPALKPEKSRQRSIGLVLQPVRDLSVGIDYFSIVVDDIISQPSAQEVVSRFRSGDPAFAGLVTLNGNDVDSIIQTLQNVGTAKVKGIDLEASYGQNIGPGRLNISLSGTYMIQFDQTSPGGAVSHKVGTMVDPNGDPVLSTNTSVNDGVVLRWKHYLSGTWVQGPWSVTLAQNFYKRYRAGNDLNGDAVYVGDQALYDLNVAFTGIKNLRLALGVKNLFDKNPPVFTPTSNQFQAGYDTSQYDPRARFVYATAGYKF